MIKKFALVFLLVLIAFIPNVYSYALHENSYITIDVKSNAILLEKDADKKVYPASTTKILTCILALENLNLSDEVTVTSEMLAELPAGSSTMKLVAKDTLTVEELLNGLMIPSGNDAAIVVAYLVSGNISSFTELMNKKMEEIGCTDSHFTNPHGFHDDEHYTTAKDMAKLMLYAIKNEKFLEIISTYSFSIEPNSQVNYTRKYENTNKLLLFDDYDIYGKTGYTDEAGNVLITYTINNDYNLVTVLLDGDKSYYNYNYRFDDTLKINEYIFKNFSKKNLLSTNEISIKLIDKENNSETIFSNTKYFESLLSNEKVIKDYNIDSLNDDLSNINIKLNAKSKQYYLKDIDIPLYEIQKSKLNLNNINFKLIFSFIFEFLSIIILIFCLIKIFVLNKKKKKIIKKKYY